MNNSNNYHYLQGQLYPVKGNETILLNDPQTVWVVRSGSVILFAVTIKNGLQQGNRRYLFSCESGEALFGTSEPNSIGCQILAIPIENAELLKVERKCFQDSIANADANVMPLVEGWLQKFYPTLLDSAIPDIDVKVSQPERFSLTSGQTLQATSDKIFWVRLKDGNAYSLGIKELNLTPQTGIFPITHTMWIEADGDVQLEIQITSSLTDADILLSGLSLFHQQFLFWNHFQEKQELTEELQRLEARENLNQQVTAEALGELASPLMPEGVDDFFQDGTPLLVAAGAVARAFGSKVNPPSQSEDLDKLEQPIDAIARASRLRVRQVLLRDQWWEQDCGPLIGYLHDDEQQQPVALLPVSRNRYELYDPVKRSRIFVDADIADTVEPVAYMFYRSFPEQALSVFDVVKFALFRRGKDIVMIILTGIATTFLGMMIPQATAILMDSAIPDGDRTLLLQIGLGLIIAAFTTTVFTVAQGFALMRLETTSDSSTQGAMWDRLLNLPVSFFRKYTTGDLMSRVNSVSEIRREIGSSILMKLITSLFALLNLGLLFFYSSQLSLLAVATAIVVVIITISSGAILVRKVRPLLEIKGKLFGEVVQLINGISKLRVAGAEQRAFAFWSKQYSRQIKLELSTELVENMVAVFNTVMPTLTSALLYWFAVMSIVKAQMTGLPGLSIGVFLAFNSAFGTFVGGATQMSDIVIDILQITPQWKRAQPIVEMLPEVQQDKADPGKLLGKITVERVSFRYQKEAPLILQDVTICAEPGEFIALVGGSGSGKSTLFRLLLGFETAEEGSIYYDGQDLSGLDVSAVRRQLGVVLQNGAIMSGSIFDNLAGGARITLDEAWGAAAMAGFDEDINAMPMGMHTVVSEGGGNLSGGQRQRLLIAKALVLKPRILFLDEATSALDNRTQAIVSKSLDQLRVTRIVIAHRLSTIRNANHIYVLQNGTVMQQGTFEQLSTKEGLFAQLMQRQMN
ncbi:MAG: NHLP bacteriocin export ABC transporter permease/ATPase subunit [Cyanobacteria bacterium P01_A01_bin.84]